MLAAVGRFFSKHPFVANASLYGTLLVSAEFTQQSLTKKILVEDQSKKQPYDIKSLGRYAILGYFISPPIGYTWYTWLDRTFVGTASKIVVKKVLLDQFVLAPPMMLLFFTTLGYMEGRENLFEEFQQKFPTAYTISCCYWLPVQTINFFLVPPQARMAYVAVTAFIWSTTMCFIKQRKHLHSLKE